MHLPRSVFSRKQLDLFLWLLRVNRVESVPSTKNMTTLNKILQGVCGIETDSQVEELREVEHEAAAEVSVLLKVALWALVVGDVVGEIHSVR